MRNIYFILFLVFGAMASAQDSLTLSGNMYEVSYNAGGARLTPEDEMGRPLYAEVYIIEIVHKDSIPKVVATLRSNGLGKFSIKLPPGTYGFITAGTTLKVGTTMPDVHEVITNHTHEFRGWGSNIKMPMVLNRDISNWTLTYYDTKSCLDCP